MDCLDASGLFELFGPDAPPAERERAEEHVDACERCRALVAAFARAADEGDGATRAMPSPFATTIASEPPPSSAMRWTPGETIAGRYRLDRIVGEGGMGVVWAGIDEQRSRPVALKLLKIDTPELHRRAAREARVTALVGHPNVVEVHEVVAVAGSPPVLVMELLVGESLDRLLARRGPLPAREAIAVLLPLVAAVRAAHACGVLHRDLKPQNVFLAREDASVDPVVMLLDFGLAKLVGQEVEVLTRTGAILGTPHYMAPEQLYGERDIDRRADVWAIGAIAYETLSARRPIEGSSYAQLVRNATRGRMTPIAELAPGAPPRLLALIDRMLSHARDGRPELAEVHAELDALARAGA